MTPAATQTFGSGQEWKSEFQIAEEWRTKNLRATLWTELVGRAAAAMREVTQARATGNEHLTVSHRMSSFWVFLRVLARQEGREEKLLATIEAVSALQTATMDSQDDVAPLFERVREAPHAYKGEWLTPSEWGDLLQQFPPHGGIPPQLAKLLSSAARLSNRMEQTKERIGLEVKRDPHTKRKLFRLKSGR